MNGIAVKLLSAIKHNIIHASVLKAGEHRTIWLYLVLCLAYVADSALDLIYTVNLSNGIRTIFSDNTGSELFDDVRLVNINDMVLDESKNRILIVESFSRAVISMDLTTGSRTVLSSNDIPSNDTPRFRNPTAIALDSANNRALVVDVKSIIAVDLSTGERTILSDNSTPDSVNPFDFIQGIVVDGARSRALVIDSNLRSIIAFDLTSGVRTLLSADGPDEMRDITLDLSNNRAIVVSDFFQTILAFDLDTGVKTQLASLWTHGGSLNGADLDSANNRLLITDSVLDELQAVNLTTGELVILSDNSVPDRNNKFGGAAAGIILDKLHNRALVGSGHHLIAVDLTTSARTVLSGDGIPNSTYPFSFLHGITLDSDNGRVLVTSFATIPAKREIIAVDLVNGGRNILSNNTIPNDVNGFLEPRSIALDKLNNRALVYDSDLQASHRLVCNL